MGSNDGLSYKADILLAVFKQRGIGEGDVLQWEDCQKTVKDKFDFYDAVIELHEKRLASHEIVEGNKHQVRLWREGAERAFPGGGRHCCFEFVTDLSLRYRTNPFIELFSLYTDLYKCKTSDPPVDLGDWKVCHGRLESRWKGFYKPALDTIEEPDRSRLSACVQTALEQWQPPTEK
jgi:hypothetical protein